MSTRRILFAPAARWTILVVATALLVAPRGMLAHASLFSSSFGSTETDTVTVDGWVDSDGAGKDASIDDEDGRIGSPTQHHARLQKGASVTRAVSTSDHADIHLTYFCRGDGDAESSDHLNVYADLNGNGDFDDAGEHVASYEGDDTLDACPSNAWSSQKDINLSAINSAVNNNAGVSIRFVGASNANKEEFRVDDVEVTGTDVGRVVIEKRTIGGDETFDFTGTGSDIAAAFSITTVTGSGSTTFTSVPPGTKTVTESAVPPGWDFTSLSCVDPDGETTVNGQMATLDLDPGETVTCMFTNTKRGHIVVHKVTDPSGDPRSFDFDATGGNYADFSLTDVADPNDQELVPGTYGVSEIVPLEGWDLTSKECSDGSDPSSIDLDPGETVKCTFTNVKRGSIRGMKFEDRNGNGEQDADDLGLKGWTIFLDTDDDGELDMEEPMTETAADGSYAFENLLPNTSYRVREVVKEGWTQTAPAEAAYSVGLHPGEEVTRIIFGNFQHVPITVYKFEDENGDGAWQREGENAESPIAGWPVRLERVTQEPGLEMPIQTELVALDLTGADGSVRLIATRPGHHLVIEDPREGWRNSAPGDSFFDVFVEVGGVPIDHGVPGGHDPLVAPMVPLWFGNYEIPTLTVIKHVVNELGGSKSAADFLLHVRQDGTDVVGSPAAGSEVGTTYPLVPGEYAVGEDGLENYIASISGSCAADGTVTLGSGDKKTCTITNEYVELCRGLVPTIVGTDGADVLEGTEGPDVILARGGNDTIRADEGDDVICAGPGDDNVKGAQGNDWVDGGLGEDQIRGGSGDDELFGDEDDDDLDGGSGRDVADGGAGNDEVSGGSASDTVRGGTGDDKLKGGSGSDNLDGGADADTCNGGSGADTAVSCETLSSIP